MNVLLSTAQNTIAMGLNSCMAYLTLNPSDIPTAHDQAELIRLFAVPLSHSAVHYDGYYAVKLPIMASLLRCFGASLSNADSSSNPRSNSSSTNDDVDDDDGGGEGILIASSITCTIFEVI